MCDSSGSASTDSDSVDQGVYQCIIILYTTMLSHMIMSIACILLVQRLVTNDCTCIESLILIHVVPLL